jgi:hypothetical protein
MIKSELSPIYKCTITLSTNISSLRENFGI